MKKEGFTLIELLAVIVVLALLALLTITTVSSQFKDKKDELYNQQLKTIKMAAEMWGSENKSKLEQYDDKTCITITLGYLKNEGYVDKDIKNQSTDELLKDYEIFINISRKNKGYKYEIIDDISKKCEIIDFNS